MRDYKIRGRSDPPSRGPDEGCDYASDGREKDSRAGAAHRPHTRKLRSAAWLEGSFRQMADRLAAQGVSRLNRERIKRPEIRFSDSKQWTPAEPARGDDSEKQKRGADSVQFQDSGKDAADPRRHDKRREAEDRRRQHDRRNPCEQKLRQADLGQEAAGDRQKRFLLRARDVVLGVTVARIEDRPLKTRLAALKLGLGARGNHVGRLHGVRQQVFRGVEAQ